MNYKCWHRELVSERLLPAQDGHRTPRRNGSLGRPEANLVLTLLGRPAVSLGICPTGAARRPKRRTGGPAGPRCPGKDRVVRKRASAADLGHSVLGLGEFQHLRQISPGLRRRGRRARLLDGHMINDKRVSG
jgi:hypothetical protein